MKESAFQPVQRFAGLKLSPELSVCEMLHFPPEIIKCNKIYSNSSSRCFICYCRRNPFKVAFFLLRRWRWNFQNPHSDKSVCLAERAALSHLAAPGTPAPAGGALSSPAQPGDGAAPAEPEPLAVPTAQATETEPHRRNTERATSEQKPRRKRGTRGLLIYGPGGF